MLCVIALVCQSHIQLDPLISDSVGAIRSNLRRHHWIQVAIVKDSIGDRRSR